eukprot:8785134-Pyramimonas_sp.AAC.1
MVDAADGRCGHSILGFQDLYDAGFETSRGTVLGYVLGHTPTGGAPTHAGRARRRRRRCGSSSPSQRTRAECERTAQAPLAPLATPCARKPPVGSAGGCWRREW